MIKHFYLIFLIAALSTFILLIKIAYGIISVTTILPIFFYMFSIGLSIVITFILLYYIKKSFRNVLYKIDYEFISKEIDKKIPPNNNNLDDILKSIKNVYSKAYFIFKEKTMATNMTKEMFIEKISELEEFKFKGDKPVFIDFWAPWCGPCKMVGPIVEELAKEYEGKVDVYKINTDEETELASAFGIQSIPTLIFVPMSGEIKSAMGAVPRTTLKKAFQEILGV